MPVFRQEGAMKEGIMRVFTILTMAIIGLGTPLAVAAGGQPMKYSGEADFQTYCASCHGSGAKGDGMIAKSLPRKPADLTQLSTRNHGVFPDDKTFKTIEGRTAGAHGDADMPVWVEVFAKSSDSTGIEAAKARISVLVRYLETLQDKK
jgi:mono/diheme cytochrome c family protein